jgi:Fe-S-cluster containining protein
MTPLDSAEVDLGLLRGFRYACRPGCGLCCFAEPRCSPEERTRLLRIAPLAELGEGDEGGFLVARGDGGACGLLRDLSCVAHDARPHPCREFPVTVHVGERAQVSVVLSCPGVELSGLAPTDDRDTLPDPAGFDGELGSALDRLEQLTAPELEHNRRRHRHAIRLLERDGRWQEESEVREELRRELPRPGAGDFPAEDPPAQEDGLEYLPLFYAGRPGPVALATGLGGWELLELRAEGGVRTHLGVVPPPDRPPPLDAAADALLRAYLRYHLERDAFLAGVVHELAAGGEGDVRERATLELRALGATVVSRALVRAKLGRDPRGPLTAADLADGIRATDQEALDRPTWGFRL